MYQERVIYLFRNEFKTKFRSYLMKMTPGDWGANFLIAVSNERLIRYHLEKRKGRQPYLTRYYTNPNLTQSIIKIGG
jgi:hypothetical protein